MENNIRSELKWYMITTISGKEEKVIESLQNRVISESMEDLFQDFKVAMVPHVTPTGREKTRNLFPGYIFIKMVMTNEAWFVVRNTQYVTGLVGSSGKRAKPTPVSNLEIRRIDKQVVNAFANFKSGFRPTHLKIGLIVEVLEGPMAGQRGQIIEIVEERQAAVVELILFERKTPTELPFNYLEVKE